MAITRPIILLSVLAICLSSCCNQTVCNGYCICGINQCASQIPANGTNITLKNTPSYFYFEPQFDTYAKIEIILCGSNIEGVINILYAKVESEQGDYPNQNNTKEVTFKAQALCNVFYGAALKFDNLPNGNRKKLLMALSTSKDVQEEMSIFIEGQHSILSSLVVTFFATLVAIIVLLLLGAPIMYLRRRCLRNKRLIEAQDVSHIDKYMPVKKLTELKQGLNCSVCLGDIVKDDQYRTTPCQHTFHKLCIDDWCKKSMSCPNCRQDLSKKTLKEKKKPKRSWFGNNMRNVLVEEATPI